MTLSEAQAWAVIIAAIAGAGVSILAAVQTRARLQETQGAVVQVRQQVEETQSSMHQVSQQVEEVYQLTDKKLSEQQALLEQLRGRITAFTQQRLSPLFEPDH